MPKKTTDKLELAAMIKALRSQLVEAQREGEGEDIRFTIEDVELELEIAAEQQLEAGIAAKFYVLTSSLKGNRKDAVTQKMRLKLKAHDVVIDPKDGEKRLRPSKICGKVRKQK